MSVGILPASINCSLLGYIGFFFLFLFSECLLVLLIFLLVNSKRWLERVTGGQDRQSPANPDQTRQRTKVASRTARSVQRPAVCLCGWVGVAVDLRE